MASAEERDPRILFPVKAPTRTTTDQSATETREAGGQEHATIAPVHEPALEPKSSSMPVAERSLRPLVPAAKPSAFQRSVGAIRSVIPIVQKILPLLDGNVASAVSNLLVPQRSPEPVNLAPLENAVVKLHNEHLDLRSRVTEQNTMLKRVGDQLDLVKEASDRHAIGQQELLDDLHGLRKRVHAFAWIGVALLVISIGINVILFLRVQRIIP